MKLKLNKKSVKTLSSDIAAMPAGMTPQVAGGQAQPDSSYITYRNCPSRIECSGRDNTCPPRCMIP
ncbi:hypothetical protein BGP78_18725 [Pseudoalteromonas sp. MSK9-3]|uniref:hypothetical protein n=1 Tax=Pseudoalteromonas sp. MSK9-3 TaxID=1897633 RepID=UPI000E6B7831|nr:hypothetical protein [Pseudoalteromonas sp. MSK9-3]RJE73450.1 hypothetical protein BGP78_18725 [Pseudoalteromonas sp. MSK9-3]